MSIEIIAKVENDNAIFLTGESIPINVSLRNIKTDSAASLAWGCIQLHCEQISKTNVEPAQRVEGGTSVSRAKEAIFSSKPNIIFCDLSLKPSELQEFTCVLEIPENLPPSFKGHFSKYVWYISIAVQNVDAPIKVINLPIKILNNTVDIKLPKKSSDNPFLSNESQCLQIAEIASNTIDDLTSVRNPRFFKINNESGVLATVTLFKNSFRLGDDVVGRIVFENENTHSLQFLVRLETVEIDLHSETKEEHVISHDLEYNVCTFLKECHFKLHIPLQSVPSFTSDTVQLKWRLHFEFVTSTTSPIQVNEGISHLINDLNIETMNWDHYIYVHTCNPYNAGLSCTTMNSSVSHIV